MTERWLTVAEVARVLNVGKEAVRKLVYSGQIGYVNMNPGGQYIMARFTPQHLEEFKRRHEVEAG